MTFNDEDLSAFLDGELDTARMAEIEAALETDQNLVERMEALASADKMFVGTYSAIDEIPMPEAVLDALDAAAADRPDAPTAPHITPVSRRRWDLPIAAAVALGAGILIGTSLLGDNAGGQSETIFAAGPISTNSNLHSLLESAPGGTENNGVQILLTFATQEGGYCREITSDHAQAVACRNDEAWTVQVAAASQRTASEQGYQTATGESEAIISAWIDDRIEGDPISAETETNIIQRNWKTK